MTNKRIDMIVRCALLGIGAGILGSHFDSWALTFGIILVGLAFTHGEDK
jgi:hypothetical protein